ncbi:hypothetical protein CYLTODRAFT_493971 [Cylindrobasidium torrendii FP15055 ss-10]|uniref:Queuosine 5'-phosphate N-glycosylase/hydrolase n=1 Tax=Cylindrobasidium torrendii FP15055 ss-10 TaxID=1314674 RepID=A0A0D7B1G6_9AGAR|nr:hypothetical protein CYLTODRAFT_493971 [Cylindrobasidium torrendii FP15055 ss-10]
MSNFPASGTYINSVRESSRRARTSAGIKITDEAVARLLQSPAFTGSFADVSKNHGLALPLKFSSPLAELNVISILSLLNFGSGWRIPLHKATGRGAWDSIRAFVLGLYLVSTTGEGDLVSARGMQTIDASKVAELLGVSIHEERPHESIPGITVGTLGGPMYDYCQKIVGVLTETGNILVNAGYPDLGTLVAQALEEGAKVKDTKADADSEVILERLVKAIPGFQDMSTFQGEPVYCFKKALFLINAIRVRFGSTSPPFPLPASTSDLPIFSDNVIPSILVHLGVVDLSASPLFDGVFPGAQERVASLLAAPVAAETEGVPANKKEGPILSLEQSFVLRAAAIDACEILVEAARNSDTAPEWVRTLTLSDLDAWLWQVAKDRADFRRLERFVDRDTVYF